MEKTPHISAEIVADSVWKDRRITTLKIRVPRIILAEFNTHRAFCRNFSSSRAIPARKLRAEALWNPFIPVYFGANQSGMSASKELVGWRKWMCRHLWTGLGKVAILTHFMMEKCGLHKQICNRILEPWLSVTGVVTATEWDNFFKVRCSKFAQPEMEMLATAIRDEIKKSTPQRISVHLPWLDYQDITNITRKYGGDRKKAMTDLVKIAVARTCRVSYNNMLGKKSEPDADIKKFNDLLRDGHMSPFEAVALPDTDGVDPIYHHRNFRGWSPLRSFLEPEDHRDLLVERYGIDLR